MKREFEASANTVEEAIAKLEATLDEMKEQKEI